MSKQNVISARVSDDVLAMVDRLAASKDRSRAWLVSRLLEKSVKEAVEFEDFIQTGIDSADRGDVIRQEEMEAWFEARVAGRTLPVAAE
jgi:predicted transcriptional regulator